MHFQNICTIQNTSSLFSIIICAVTELCGPFLRSFELWRLEHGANSNYLFTSPLVLISKMFHRKSFPKHQGPDQIF